MGCVYSLAMFRIITIFYFLGSRGTYTKGTAIKPHLRILDGRDAVDGEYPYVVILFRLNRKGQVKRFCTGSTLTQNWVLTAAHCMQELTPPNFGVWYANFTVPPYKTGQFTKVNKIFIHPSYRNNKFQGLLVYNDICMLLTDNIKSEKFGRLSSVDHLTMIGLPVTYVGGGRTEDPDGDRFRRLQVGEGGIISCEQRSFTNTKYMICVTPKCDNRFHSPLNGDSGGPLLLAGNIIGVCSFASFSRTMSEPVYAPVSPYIDWILSVMQNGT